jgi:TrmH RNA methyltransferase
VKTLTLEKPRISLEPDDAGAEARKSVRQNHDEVKLYGVNACQTLARRRIEDIVRVYVTEERIKNFGHVLSWCAQNKRAYHVVTADEMEKIAETMHHEGVCMLAKARRMADFTTLVGREKNETGASSILFLENIGNSHNLGAILRVASHFGVTAVVVVSEDSAVKGMAPSVFRVAEGGAETVDVAFVNDAVRALRALKHAGYTLVATSSHMKDSLYASRLPQRVVLMLGSETNGLSTQCLREADKRVAIPGTGNVESLNVSCAATAILGEFWRTHRS